MRQNRPRWPMRGNSASTGDESAEDSQHWRRQGEDGGTKATGGAGDHDKSGVGKDRRA